MPHINRYTDSPEAFAQRLADAKTARRERVIVTVEVAEKLLAAFDAQALASGDDVTGPQGRAAMTAWAWKISGRDGTHYGSHPRDFVDEGTVEAENVAEAAVIVTRDEVEWLGLDDTEPVTLVLAPALSDQDSS